MMTTVQTRTLASARTFVETIGINVHVGQSGTAYADPTKVAAALGYLGVDLVRTHLPSYASGLASINVLAKNGIKFDFTPVPHLTEQTVDVAGFIAGLEALEKVYPGSVAAIEGPNEVNIYAVSVGGVKSIASAAEVQKQLYSAVKQSEILKDIPVYNVSIGATNADLFKQLGDLSSFTDYANSHAYAMSTSNISAALEYLIDFAKISAPDKPVVITEAGYNTLESYWYNGVSEIVQAKYTLDTLMSAFDQGVAKTYLYELYDFQPDLRPSSANSHYGLFNADGTPKLAATAIHNLTTILSDNEYATTSLGNEDFTYCLKGMPFRGQDLVLGKTNGSVDLVVWSEPIIWSQLSQSAIVAPTSTVTVTFGSVEGRVDVYDPLLGTSIIATYYGVSEIKVDISDHPLIIEVNATATSTADSKTFAGNNTMIGGQSADLLRGYAGDDTLYGNAGNDRIHGSTGADLLYGGSGLDTFVYNSITESTVSSGGRDTIFDFTKGDRIDLRVIDANFGAAGNQSFTFVGEDVFHGLAGEVRYETSSSQAKIYGDINGDGQADFSIVLQNVTKLSEGDFLL